ncbi:hypothetical protein [Mycobacteroides chelonae]|nr:hypothetical protein [Mycobacteroides chelonae]
MKVIKGFSDELPNVRKAIEELRSDPAKVDRLHDAMEDEIIRRSRRGNPL